MVQTRDLQVPTGPGTLVSPVPSGGCPHHHHLVALEHLEVVDHLLTDHGPTS